MTYIKISITNTGSQGEYCGYQKYQNSIMLNSDFVEITTKTEEFLQKLLKDEPKSNMETASGSANRSSKKN